MYATGKQSLGLCDICGVKCDYSELRDYIYNERPNGLRVCPDCFDKDQEQLQVYREAREDPQTLFNPRSDSPDWVSRGLASWNPIPALTFQLSPGKATATAS